MLVIFGVGIIGKNYSVKDLDFKSDEETKISLLTTDDLKSVYQYYENDSTGGIRKKSDKETKINTGRPYWTSNMLEMLRREKPIEGFSNIPGLLVQDGYTKSIYFVKWNTELANVFCETIKEDQFKNVCEKYKNYTYQKDWSKNIKYSTSEPVIDEKYQLKLGNVTYIILEDDTIIRNSSEKKIISPSFSSGFEEIINEIKQESHISEEEKEFMLYDIKDNTYYEIVKESNSSKSLVDYLIRISEGYYAKNLQHKYAILKYEGNESVNDWFKIYEMTSNYGFQDSNYKEILYYYSYQKDSKPEFIEMESNYFVLKDGEDYYVFDMDLYGNQEKYNQEEHLKKLNQITLYFEDDFIRPKFYKKDFPKNQQYTCKKNCEVSTGDNKLALIKDDDYYIYDGNTHEVIKLQRDITKDYRLINKLESLNAYVLYFNGENEKYYEIIDKQTQEPLKKIFAEKNDSMTLAEVNSQGNWYYLLGISVAYGIDYYYIYNQNFDSILSPLQEDGYSDFRFYDYYKLDNGNLLLLYYKDKEKIRDKNGYLVYKTFTHVEINPKGELINPQIYDGQTIIFKDIVFEINEKTIKVYDMYHKELTSTDFIKTSKAERIGWNCLGGNSRGEDGNNYFIHAGNEGPNAKKYIYHKNTNSITVEDSECYIEEK